MPFGFPDECYKCRLNRYIYDVELPEKEKEAYVKKQLEKIKNAPDTLTATEFRELLKEEYNKAHVAKDYRPINHKYNMFLLDESKKLKEKINNSSDPLLCSLKLALVGNYIDLDAFNEIDDDFLLKMIDEVESKEIDMSTYKKLKEDLNDAKSLVYLSDNCGEIVLDKLFIEEIKDKYPNVKITVLVRGGGDTINDATLIDAKEIGLDKVCDVLDNGLEGTSTKLNLMPDDRKKLIDEANVIIAKGQANAESLNGSGKNIYYIFLCKCNKFANQYHAKKFDGILTRDINAK